MPNFTKVIHTSEPERFCKYIHRYCNQTRLVGYDYCIRHILEDKTAPFRQCMYVNQLNKKRCNNAAPKAEKNERRDSTVCPFHAKRAQMKKTNSSSYHPKKKQALEGPAALLRYLEHYCTDPAHDANYNRETGLSEKLEMTSYKSEKSSSLEQAEASMTGQEIVQEKARIESMDDETWIEKASDYLEHAGVYTEKEVLTIARDKIFSLQKLYCDELKIIYRELKEKRRNFLAASKTPSSDADIKQEDQKPLKLIIRDLKDIQGKFFGKVERPIPSTSTAPEPSFFPEIDEKILYSLSRYHRRDGVERNLRLKAQEKRSGVVKPLKPMCIFEENGTKCLEPALVLSRFCKSHILLDPKQVMYVPCEVGKNCKTPVLFFDVKNGCDRHFNLSFPNDKEIEPVESLPENDLLLEPEQFQSIEDIESFGLDSIARDSLFGLDQFGEPGESTDTVMSEDQNDLMQIQPITLHPPSDILSDDRRSESE